MFAAGCLPKHLFLHYAAVVTGGDITDLGAIDGKDLWTVLVDDRPSPRTEILYNINYQWKLAAIRVGWHKLVLGASPEDQHDDCTTRTKRKYALRQREQRVFNS
ncbi:hypothetical protein HPB51_010459 [Rhipicephalus microplus]|uniref:Uncharacterized protein n=1 Tax=Rhipicephalus microplus TaxID=6941 RepID=A0A9J6E0N5_RHIMP|nr:hypothetical protein HPB51_010459 [Rhipicephalus microplus]